MYTTQRKSCIRPRSRTNVVRQYDTLNGKMATTCPTVDYLRCAILTVPANVGKNKLWAAQIVFGKREVSAHTLEYQREEDVARKQKVTQRRQYRELIDIVESHEGVLLFARCIFAATWSPKDTHNRGT